MNLIGDLISPLKKLEVPINDAISTFLVLMKYWNFQTEENRLGK